MPRRCCCRAARSARHGSPRRSLRCRARSTPSAASSASPGCYRGRPVSVQATGMGRPSLAIYVHELVTLYGVKTLVRIGTCGGIDARVGAALGGHRRLGGDGCRGRRVRTAGTAPDEGLFAAAERACQRRRHRPPCLPDGLERRVLPSRSAGALRGGAGARRDGLRHGDGGDVRAGEAARARGRCRSAPSSTAW